MLALILLVGLFYYFGGDQKRIIGFWRFGDSNKIINFYWGSGKPHGNYAISGQLVHPDYQLEGDILRLPLFVNREESIFRLRFVSENLIELEPLVGAGGKKIVLSRLNGDPADLESKCTRCGGQLSFLGGANLQCRQKECRTIFPIIVESDSMVLAAPFRPEL